MIMTRLSPKDCVLSKWLAVSAGLLCISMLAGCSRDSSGKQPVDPRKTALPVTAGTAVQKDVPLQGAGNR